MSKILLIGNSGFKKNINDGQTIKTRIYLKKIKDEGFDVMFVDLDSFFRHFVVILHKIRRGIKICDRIVLLAAERGSKVLIPFINFCNRKFKKPFVLPLVGIGVLHSTIDNLSYDEVFRFFRGNDLDESRKSKKIAKQLQKIDCILPETQLICDAYTKYYHLNNVIVLNNFREYKIIDNSNIRSDSLLRVAFISRIWREKGIFDLLDVVNQVNKTKMAIRLDIYGPKESIKEDNLLFDEIVSKSENVNYFGTIKEGDVIYTLSKYDLLVFPTRYLGEGTPGIISESLMAGTPILTSDFLQARCLLTDGFDSVFFRMADKKDLEEKINYLIGNRNILSDMRKNALINGRKFTYEASRNVFLQYVCGVKNN